MRTRWLLLAALLLAPLAAAHAVPYDSQPAQGQRLDAVPAEVVVRFTEPVYEDGTSLRVEDADGVQVDLGDLRIEPGSNPVLRVGLPDDLPDGAYRIVWQTYSQRDGHTVGGAIGFAVGGFAPPSDGGDGVDAFDAGGAVARTLMDTGYALAFGAFAWLYVERGAPVRPRWLVAAGVLVAVGNGLLVLDTAVATGLGRAYLGTEGGHALLARTLLAAGIALLTPLWLLGRRVRAALPLLGAAWLLLAWLGSGYGHIAGRSAAIHLVEALHLLAIATWIGGLALLAATLLRPGDRGTDSLWVLGRRFGTLALPAVAVMAGSGLVLFLLIVGPGRALSTEVASHPWGAVLWTKVSVAALMVLLAAVNRHVLLASADERGGWRGRLQAMAARLSSGRLRPAGDAGPLRTLVVAEAAFGALTLVLAGSLLSLGAPTEAPDITAGFEADAQGDVYLGAFLVTPEPTAGVSHSVRIYVQEDGGAPQTQNTCGREDCLTLRWSADAEGEAGAQYATAVPEGDGWWHVDGVLFATAGDHTLELTVQTAEVYLDVLAVTVPVAATD